MEKLKAFLFKNTNTKQTIAKNTFWLFASETLGRLLKMVLVIYAARVLGAAGWGVFSYAISIASLLMIFSDIGINDLVTREVVQKKEGYKTFVSTALLLKVGILLASSLLVIIVSPYISHVEEARALFPVIAIVLFFDAMRELGLAINRASEKMERDMIVKSITNALILILGVILLKVRPAPESMALAYAIGSTVGFFTIAIIIRHDMRSIISKADKKIVGTVLQLTWPFALINLIAVVMGNTDVYMLGIWRSATEIGLYASVQRIWQFLLIIPATLAVPLLPILSREANTDNVRFRNILEKSLALTLIIGIPITLGGIAFAEPIIRIIFGEGYLAAVPILRVIMTMSLLSFPLIPLSNAIFAYNKQKSLTVAYLSGIIGNVALNILLIPQYGAVGSAIATLASTTIITATVWMKMNKINHFEMTPRLAKAIVSAIAMLISIIVLKVLHTPEVISMILSVGVYVGTLFALRESSFREIWNLTHS